MRQGPTTSESNDEPHQFGSPGSLKTQKTSALTSQHRLFSIPDRTDAIPPHFPKDRPKMRRKLTDAKKTGKQERPQAEIGSGEEVDDHEVNKMNDHQAS
ncbi:unnamed protein product, partial [Darwinula stevensoni]